MPQYLLPCRFENAGKVARQFLDFKRNTPLKIVGYGFSCVPPEDILSTLNEMARDEGLFEAFQIENVELVAYANLQVYARKLFDTGYCTDHKRHSSPSSRFRIYLVKMFFK